ncbi:MAG: Ig-like domain repeat protein [Propionicimonas sp.]
MTHTTERAPARSLRTPARRGRITAAMLAATLGASALATAPAFADTGTWLNGGNTGATISVADAVIAGDAIHLEGSGWLDNQADGDANGSWIAIKLGAATGVEAGPLTTEPAEGQFTFPGAGGGTPAIWSGVIADDDGDFSIDVPFPTAGNTKPALDPEWAPGTTHHLQLLTGSLKPGGDTPRSVYLTFTVSADTLNVTATAGGRGAPAGQVTINVSASAGRFAADEPLTAKVDGQSTPWTAGGTASATGALTGTTIVYAPGTLAAGSHTVEITGPTTGTVSRTVTVLPTASYSALTQGAEGVLTLSNLPAGSSVKAVSFGDAEVTFSGLPAAVSDGVATVPYTIAADTALGSYPVTVELTDPAVTFTLANQKISPDTRIFGEDGFALVSNGEDIFQGLYQSAYSASQDALFVTAASGTGANEDGYLYKLDPDTLQVIASVHPKDQTVGGETGKAPYGVGVDDVNGKVWVTNTRTNTLAVYAAADLTLVKQFPTGTISHSRDAIYDPLSDRVFVSSASEGTNGDGYISVFDAKTLEEVTKLQTGPRTVYSPMSLAVDNGTLVSPSLSTNKVVKVDTTSLEFTFLEVEGINVGGRGASGIAYDAAANRIFVASQNSDEVVVANATTGATIKEVPTGAGALNVALDKVNHLAYVTNFGGSTVTVLDEDGTKVANLPIARANHASVDGQGNAYVVDKAAGNQVWKISVVEKPDPEPEPEPVAPVAKVNPSISGTPVVGGTLTAKPGTWTVAGLSFGYQWLRDGAVISGATKATYLVASVDAGKNLQVRVTASKTGLPNGTATSAAIKAGKALTKTPTPTISGTAKVGKTLKVKAGSWAPSKVTLAYQWLRDGAPIAKATKTSYKLTKADAGRRISVRVTGSKTGYVSVAKTSKAKTVAKVKATVKLSVPSKVAKGKQATVKVTVTGAVSKPTGKVTVTVNGKKVTSVLTAAGNGKVSVKLPALKKKGSYKVKASFSPTGETAVSTSKSSTVSKKLKVK